MIFLFHPFGRTGSSEKRAARAGSEQTAGFSIRAASSRNDVADFSINVSARIGATQPTLIKAARKSARARQTHLNTIRGRLARPIPCGRTLFRPCPPHESAGPTRLENHCLRLANASSTPGESAQNLSRLYAKRLGAIEAPHNHPKMMGVVDGASQGAHPIHLTHPTAICPPQRPFPAPASPPKRLP